MVLKCQEDSYLREWSARVESCEELKPEGGEGGFRVQLSETIIFPEGGGQPSDEGYVGGLAVQRLERNGGTVWHYLKGALSPGVQVPLSINWERRFDHMQQHSGQHLLSAILEHEYAVDTTSWWLGAEECHVEVAGPPGALLALLPEVEARCNALIREARPVTVALRPATPAELQNLPEDQREELLRVVTIAGVDDNPCCGTHVTNLSQLQAIKVLGVIAGKKGKSNIRFLVGDRILQRLQLCLDREDSLTRLLKGQASHHNQLIEKLQAGAKAGQKLLEEVAQLEGARALAVLPPGEPLVLHRARAAPAYLPALARALSTAPPEVLLFLSAGDENGPGGSVTMRGPKQHIAVLAPKVCRLLQGKGAAQGEGERYQAKAGNMAAICAAQNSVREYFLFQTPKTEDESNQAISNQANIS